MRDGKSVKKKERQCETSSAKVEMFKELKRELRERER
jgi:hypothetical protein